MENIFSDRIKKLRQERDMTQVDLAKKLGITTSALSFFESGSRIPNIEVLKNIATIFNVSSAYLIGLSENKKNTNNLETYADMIGHIIPLLEQSDAWYIWLESLPYNGGEQVHGLGTSDNIILDFLNDYEKMSELTDKSSVPEDLFRTWIDGRIQSLKDTPLLQKRSKPDDQ